MKWINNEILISCYLLHVARGGGYNKIWTVEVVKIIIWYMYVSREVHHSFRSFLIDPALITTYMYRLGQQVIFFSTG